MRRAALLLSSLAAACGEPASRPEVERPAPPSTGPFTDVTASYGLDRPQAAFRSGIGSDCETALFMTGAAAAGDLNGDGYPDLYLPRLGLPDRLMINLEGRGFEDRAESAGLALDDDGGGATLFDRDADGDLDLLRSSPTGPPRLFDNDGDGHFTEVEGAAGIVVPEIEAGGCSRSFGASVADYDADGDLDVLTAAWTDADRSRLFDNDGEGRFTDVTAARGLDLSQVALLTPTFVDLDLDGDLDLVAVADFDDTKVYLQTEDRRFIDVTATSTLARIHDGMGADLGDVDGDGALDLYVSGICFPWNGGCLEATGWTGNHLFAPLVPRPEDVTDRAGVRDAAWAWGAAFFDPDLDGDLDLVVTNGYGGFVELERTRTRAFVNDGAGRFTERGADWGLTDDGQGRAVVTFDLEGDGDEDVLVVNHASAPVLYRNDLGAPAAALTVTVDLGPKNPRGIGAEVRLIGPAGPTIRLIHGNSRYLSAPEAVARFGGVDPDAARTLEVWWGGARIHAQDLEAPLPARLHVRAR